MNFIREKLIPVFLRALLWGGSLTLGTLFICVSALILSLLSGRIDLENYKSYAEYALQGTFPNSSLEFESAHLKWDAENWAFALHAKKAKIKSTTSKNKFKVPKLYLTWPLTRVLLFGFYPTTVNLKKPQIKIRHLEEDDEKEDNELFHTLQRILLDSPIEKVIISEADLNLKTSEYGIWKLKETNIVFQKQGEEINGSFIINIKNIGKITGNLLTQGGKPRKLQIAFKQINPKQVLTHPNLQKTPFVRKNKEHLSDINMPLSGVLTLYFTDSFDLEGYKFNFECSKGTLKYKPYLPQVIPLNSIKVAGKCEKNIVSLDSISIDSPHFVGELEGNLTLSPSFMDPDNIEINLKGNGKNLKFQHVNLLWPKEVSTITRQWIIENILEGNVPGATINLHANYNLRKEIFTLHKLNGYFLAENTILKYLEGLPEIQNVRAKVFYNKDILRVQLLGGNTFAQKITSGKVIISDLQAEDQFIDINLKVEGPLEDALKLINVPRLKYAEKYGINPELVKGYSSSTLNFKFPLERKTTLDKVDITVNSTLKDTLLPEVVSKPKVTLSQADLKLDLTKSGMTIQGTGLLNKASSKIKWQENFKDQSKWQSKLSVGGSLSETQFKEMGLSLADYYKGKAPLELSFTKFNDHHGDLSINLDLENVDITIPEFRASSKAGEKGSLSLKLITANGFPQTLKSFKLDCGNSLQFSCIANFVKNTHMLNHLKLIAFKTTQDQYSGQVIRTENGFYKASLNGSYLDLDTFIKNRDDLEKSFLSSIPYSAVIHFKKAEINGKPFFTNMSAQLEQSEKGYMKRIDLKSEISGPFSKQEFCTLQLSTHANKQNVSMKLDDLGTVLAAFGAENNLKGGKTKITATRTLSHPFSPWQGEYVIEDFEVLKAPILVRLLKIVSPLAFVDVFSKGQGLKFTNLKGGFAIKSDNILLKKSLAVGPSIGMTVQGLINRKQKILNLNGTVIPLYMLNSMVSYIPIIGQLLTGGTGEGVLAISYSMKGPLDHPQIQSNPLSAVTPGIFRKIFDSELAQK